MITLHQNQAIYQNVIMEGETFKKMLLVLVLYYTTSKSKIPF